MAQKRPIFLNHEQRESTEEPRDMMTMFFVHTTFIWHFSVHIPFPNLNFLAYQIPHITHIPKFTTFAAGFWNQTAGWLAGNLGCQYWTDIWKRSTRVGGFERIYEISFFWLDGPMKG